MRRSDKEREQDALSFAYMDLGKGREQDALSFAYMDLGKGREQDALSFDSATWVYIHAII